MERDRPADRPHRWVEDRCSTCGLRRREEWIRDASGAAVMALVWFTAAGQVVRVRPFPVLLGIAPRQAPLFDLEEAFPGVSVGREPGCPV